MEYNSQKEELVIREYGRNIQNIIKEAKNIEDPKKRQSYIEQVAELIMQMHPHNKNLDDYRQKIWNHIFQMSGYDLDVEAPENIRIVHNDSDHIGPFVHLPYPIKDIRHKHYGKNISSLIEKAKAMEEGPVRDEFVKVIGSYMKLAYKNWNKEHYVNDELILSDLSDLSDGQLKLNENDTLHNVNINTKRRKRPAHSSNGKHGGKRDNHSNRKRSFRKRK